MTPATEVTNVEASAAGATSAGRRPEPIKIGARIEPPPIPYSPDAPHLGRQDHKDWGGISRTWWSDLAGELDGTTLARHPAAPARPIPPRRRHEVLATAPPGQPDPATTPGNVPAMSTRTRRPPIWRCRQYRYSAPGVATTLYSRLVGVTDGLGVPRTLTWNGSSKTAPETPAGVASTSIT
jgi:hypothetical protein